MRNTKRRPVTVDRKNPGRPRATTRLLTTCYCRLKKLDWYSGRYVFTVDLEMLVNGETASCPDRFVHHAWIGGPVVDCGVGAVQKQQ